MTSIVADTHAIVWYIIEPNRLSAEALQAFEQATDSGDFIYFSDISLIEICYLVERGRLVETVFDRLAIALDDPTTGVVSLPVDRTIAQTFRQIPRATVPEMPDRIIAATALSLNLPLVTRDLKIQQLTTIQTVW